MNKGIIGKKIGMTQIFDEKGNVIPVTVIETAGNIVSQIKTVETDGYNAIQLGYGEIKDKHINKPEAGHFAKAKIANKKHLREFRLDDISSYKIGDEVKADIFAAGEKIDVQGTSKGKGFQGVIKRHGQQEFYTALIIFITIVGSWQGQSHVLSTSFQDSKQPK